MERLDKVIGQRTAYSRQDARILCRQGRVTVNGEKVWDQKHKVKPDDVLTIDKEVIEPLPEFVKFHKPAGVISSMNDDWNRESLADVLPEEWIGKLHPVGRLDADTTGLLIFSSDGKITQKLLHPNHAVEREYLATVENPVNAGSLRKVLAEGVTTAEGVVQAELLEVSGQCVRLSVTEGKYRMVRRVLANSGHPVVSLHRLRYGEIRLGKLPEGEFTTFDDAELKWIKSI